jgi:hypothetical protein
VENWFQWDDHEFHHFDTCFPRVDVFRVIAEIVAKLAT